MCLQGFHSDEFNINIDTSRNTYVGGVGLLVSLQEVGTYHKIEVFSITYDRYSGLDFSWKLVTGIHDVTRNQIHLDIMNFLSSSKFFQHLLETTYRDISQIFDKKLDAHQIQEQVADLRRKWFEELTEELYNSIITGNEYKLDRVINLSQGKLNTIVRSLRFEQTPKRRSGTLYITNGKGEQEVHEKYTNNQLDGLVRHLIGMEIFGWA
jgi:hypothetical protein